MWLFYIILHTYIYIIYTYISYSIWCIYIYYVHSPSHGVYTASSAPAVVTAGGNQNHMDTGAELGWPYMTLPRQGANDDPNAKQSPTWLSYPITSHIISYHVEKKSHSQAVPPLDPPARVPTSSGNLRSPSVSVGSYSTPTSERASSRRSGSGWLGHQRMWLEATGTTEKSEMQA